MVCVFFFVQISAYRGAPKGNFLRNCLHFGFPLDTLQELSKGIDKYILLKVLKILKGLFQKSLKWGVRGLAPSINLNFTQKASYPRT